MSSTTCFDIIKFEYHELGPKKKPKKTATHEEEHHSHIFFHNDKMLIEAPWFILEHKVNINHIAKNKQDNMIIKTSNSETTSRSP